MKYKIQRLFLREKLNYKELELFVGLFQLPQPVNEKLYTFPQSLYKVRTCPVHVLPLPTNLRYTYLLCLSSFLTPFTTPPFCRISCIVIYSSQPTSHCYEWVTSGTCHSTMNVSVTTEEIKPTIPHSI